MVSSWINALNNYNYNADLTEFRGKDPCSDGFTSPSFHTKIDRSNIRLFENAFSNYIKAKLFSRYSIIGEVYFWKIYTQQDPHSLTTIILEKLKNREHFELFCDKLHTLAEIPSLNNFIIFRKSCFQSKSFAVPITFLSFYCPSVYPMADKIVSEWWRNNKSRFGYNTSKEFQPQGRISGDVKYIENNWNAYLEWSHFCQTYASLLSLKTQTNWRARDVEMAVFYNQQRDHFDLSVLDVEKKMESSINPSDPSISMPHRGDFAGICPLCGHPLKWRESSVTGELYTGCTNFPRCKFKGERSH